MRKKLPIKGLKITKVERINAITVEEVSNADLNLGNYKFLKLPRAKTK